MKYLRFLLFPLAIIYGGIVFLRNTFYNWRILKSSSFSLPIINVGNLSMGGTGKTPHTEYLIKLLKSNYNLVTLSRGFGRKERGFILADDTATADKIGDEPLQYYRKFGTEINVAVESNRVYGVLDICRNLPNTNLILLDDAFQHRAIKAGFSILLTTKDEPFTNDFILPVGNLREFRAGAKRADVIVISKCTDFKDSQVLTLSQKITRKYNKPVFLSKVDYGELVPFSHVEINSIINSEHIILVTGIAESSSLKKYLVNKFKILSHFNFADHHRFSVSEISEIHSIFDKFAHLNPIIVTTEKDSMRLASKEMQISTKSYPWFYQSITIALNEPDKFNRLIKAYVEKNS